MPRPEESDSDGEEDGLDADGMGDGGNFTADVEGASARDVLNFARVVGDMVSTGFAEGHPAASLLMEIKGYKFAQNKVRIEACVCLCSKQHNADVIT